MFRKAGHVRRKRNGAVDANGNRHDVLNLFIEGHNYALKTNEIKKAIPDNLSVSIESIRFHWQDYLDGAVGTVYLSRSGKAVIMEFFTGKRYCVPLNEIWAVISGISGSAIISGIPVMESDSLVSRHAGSVQTMLSAF